MANPGFLSKRVKRLSQREITQDRYQFLGLNQAEPNLGDPLVGPSSIGSNPLPSGEAFILVASASSEGGRFWYPLSETDTEYSSFSGIATYAHFAGIATYAETAGIATYAETAGIATYANYSTNSGIASVANFASSAGTANFAFTSGIATNADYADSAGVSTSVFGGTASVTSLSVSGDATVAGRVTSPYFDATSASGVPTIESPTNLDIVATNVAIRTDLSVDGDININGNGRNINFYPDTQNINYDTGIRFYEESGSPRMAIDYNADSANSPNGQIEIKGFDYSINGLQSIIVLDRYGDVGIGTTVIRDPIAIGATNLVSVSGIVSSYQMYADEFFGNFTGTADYSEVSGIATYSDKVLVNTFGGNQNHYVGFFTSQSGYASVRTNGLVYNPFSGKLSAGIFSGSHTGDGSGLSNVTALNVVGGIASITDLNVSGVSTLGIVTSNDIYVTGVVTATAFYGSGGNLTDLIQSRIGGINVKDNGTSVGSAFSFTSLDFVGDYVSVTGVGTTAIIEFSTPDYSHSSGISTYSITSGISTEAIKLQTPRIFSIIGDIVGSGITFDGTGNVSIAATIQPNSVELGTDTFGDYVESISGTPNEIEITSSTGEGSTPVVGLSNNVTIQNDLTVNNNVVIDGNLTVNGTQVILNVVEQLVEDKNIVLGYSTSHNETDASANYGGISIASTEGSPLVNLSDGDIASTYKQITWIKGGTLGSGTTDAWLFNYGVGIGSTQVQNGVRLAVGSGVTISDDSITSEYFYGNLVGTSTSALNLSGGFSYSIPYQENVGVTSFLPIGPETYVLGVSSGKPQWVEAASSGAIEGITLLDNGTLVGYAASINLINFVGNNLSIDAIGAGATITFVDQQYVNFAGIATVAITAGYASTSGISTVSGGLTGTPNIIVGVVTANNFISTNTTLQPPTIGDYSGERLRLYDFENLTNTNYAIGVEQNNIWFGVDNNADNQGFKWYGETTQVMRLGGTGNLTLEGNLRLNGNTIQSSIGTTAITLSDKDVTVVNLLGNNADFTGIVTAFDYNTTSDKRLKENINKIENSLEIISELNGVTFNWKDSKKQSAGVIAQEVEAVLPELVSDGETKTVNYNGLIGLLIESVKSLKEENLELKQQIQRLNEKVFGDS